MVTFSTLNLGAVPDDGTGDTLRSGGQKINNNFAAAKVAIEAMVAGVVAYKTKADRDADTTQTDGRIGYVYRDDVATNRGFFQWNDAGNVWEDASWYFDALAGAIQPLVDETISYKDFLLATIDSLSTVQPDGHLGIDFPPTDGTPFQGSAFMYADVIQDGAVDLETVEFFAHAAGAFTLIRERVVDGRAQEIDRYTYQATSPGLKSLSPADFGEAVPLIGGERIAILAPGVATYDGGQETGGGWSAIGADGTFPPPGLSPRLLIRITYNVKRLTISAEQISALEDAVDTIVDATGDLPLIRDRVALLGRDLQQRIGRQVSPVLGGQPISANTFAYAEAINITSKIKRVLVKTSGPAAGVQIVRYREASPKWILLGKSALVPFNAAGDLDLSGDLFGDFEAQPGDKIAFFNAGGVTYTPGGGADSGGWLQVSDGAPENTIDNPELHNTSDAPRPEITIVMEGFKQDVTSERILSLEAGIDSRVPLPDADRLWIDSQPGVQHFLGDGQSNSTGVNARDAISTVQPHGNVTFGSGVTSKKPGNDLNPAASNPGTSTIKPLIEQNSTSAAPAGDESTNSGETPCSGGANKLTELLAQRHGITPDQLIFLASTAGHTGVDIAYLSDPTQNHPWGGSGWFRNIRDHVSEAKARAAEIQRSYACQFVFYMQGEADAANGLSRGDYYTRLRALRADLERQIRISSGRQDPVHMLIYQTAGINGATLDQVAAIKLAQMDAVRDDPRIHFAGPIYHLAPSNDNVHLSNVSQLRYGRTLGRAAADLYDGFVPECLWPLAATSIGDSDTITLRFRVPRLPMVLDEAALGVITNKGFRVKDQAGDVPIVNVSIGNATDTVVLKMGRQIVGDTVVRHALDYAAPSNTFFNSASGCLRDSTPGTTTVLGAAYPIWHVAPAFELKVFKSVPDA